jgi:hypothetical protein
MTVSEALAHTDVEILRSGELTMVIVREWSRLTGREPAACDCQLKNYIRTVRSHQNEEMKNDVYYDGRYYDRTTITEKEKAGILESDKRLYVRLFGALPVEQEEKKEPVRKAEPARVVKKSVGTKKR